MNNMNEDRSQDPLHGKSLEVIVNYLVDMYGWKVLGNRIKIKCFTTNPSVKSSLIFLRKSPWAREMVEKMYVESVK